MKRSVIAVLASGLVVAGFAVAEDWPQFRGADYRSVSPEKEWQAEWPSDSPPPMWKARVHSGASSVAVVDGRVYTQGVERLRPDQVQELKTKYPGMEGRYRELLICLDAETGEYLWTTPMDRGRISGRNMSYPTPAVSGGRVYAYSTSGILMCAESATGKIVWERDLMADLDAVDTRDGLASSPFLHDGRVHLHIKLPKPAAEQGDREGWHRTAYVHTFAFDMEDGKEEWRSSAYDPGKDGGNHSGGCWSSPVYMELEGMPTLVSYFGNMLVGLNPEDGSERWQFNLEPILARNWGSDERFRKQFYSSTWPLQVGNNGLLCQVWDDVPSHCYLSCTILLRIVDGKPVLDWQNDTLAVQLSNFTIWDGHIYAMDTTMAENDRRKRQPGVGQLQCLDLATGKLLWHTSDFYDPAIDRNFNRQDCDNAPTWLIVNGKIIIWDRVQIVIGEVSPEGYRRLTAFRPEEVRPGKTWAAMAFSDGRLFVRSGDTLYGIDLRPNRDEQ